MSEPNQKEPLELRISAFAEVAKGYDPKCSDLLWEALARIYDFNIRCIGYEREILQLKGEIASTVHHETPKEPSGRGRRRGGDSSE